MAFSLKPLLDVQKPFYANLQARAEFCQMKGDANAWTRLVVNDIKICRIQAGPMNVFYAIPIGPPPLPPAFPLVRRRHQVAVVKAAMNIASIEDHLLDRIESAPMHLKVQLAREIFAVHYGRACVLMQQYGWSRPYMDEVIGGMLGLVTDIDALIEYPPAVLIDWEKVERAIRRVAKIYDKDDEQFPGQRQPSADAVLSHLIYEDFDRRFPDEVDDQKVEAILFNSLGYSMSDV